MFYIDDIVPVCCVEPGKEEAACVDLDGEWAENSKVPKGGGGHEPPKPYLCLLPLTFQSLILNFFPIWTEI